MDGTASLIYLLAAKEAAALLQKRSTERLPTGNNFQIDHGAIVSGESSKKNIAIVFTGDEFADGGNTIINTLKQENIKASFFLTGGFTGIQFTIIL